MPSVVAPPAALPPVSADTLARQSASAARAFVGLARTWGLDEEEQLTLLGRNNVSRTVLYRWRRGEDPKKPLPVDVFFRISFLLGIYEGLQRIFRRAPEIADAWLRRPNTDPPFAGMAPLAFMLQGEIFAIATTRAYVDAWTGGPRTGLADADAGAPQAADALGIRNAQLPAGGPAVVGS